MQENVAVSNSKWHFKLSSLVGERKFGSSRLQVIRDPEKHTKVSGGTLSAPEYKNCHPSRGHTSLGKP